MNQDSKDQLIKLVRNNGLPDVLNELWRYCAMRGDSPRLCVMQGERLAWKDAAKLLNNVIESISPAIEEQK